MLTSEAPRRSAGSRSSGSSSRARAAATGSPAAAGRRQAPAPGRRPHGAGDHRRASARVRARLRAPPSPTRRFAASPPTRTAGVLAAASTSSKPRRWCWPRAGAVTPRPSARGELSTNHPNATGEVTQIAVGARRRGARPRRAPVPPERRRLAREHAGLLDPGDDARVRRGAAERRRRGVHRLARPARRRRQAIVDEVEKGNGVETPDGRPAVYLDTTRIARARRRTLAARTCCDATAQAGIDPLREPILTYPVLHYQNGGLVDRRATPRRRSRASTPAARSPAGRTDATA